MDKDLYIVVAYEGNEKYEYEYGNILHAREHYDTEKSAALVRYANGKNLLVYCKGKAKLAIDMMER